MLYATIPFVPGDGWMVCVGVVSAHAAQTRSAEDQKTRKSDDAREYRILIAFTMDGWRDGGMEGWRDVGMEGWRAGWLDGWMEGGIDVCGARPWLGRRLPVPVDASALTRTAFYWP